MTNIIIETDRLYMRELEKQDFFALAKILQDEKVMYAYEHAFNDQEVTEWLERQQQRYRQYGFGLWAVILKENDELIGQCGITWQDYSDGKVLEIGYLFQRKYWHHGYATESAIACKNYAFNVLNTDKVYSIIRDTNVASKNVAERNGMIKIGHFTKFYYEMNMEHDVYMAEKKK